MGKLRENLRIKLGYYLSVSGMSQKDLADRLGVSQSSITNWLKGKNSPDIDLIAEICNIFKIEITDLMDIKNSPAPAEAETEEDARTKEYASRVIDALVSLGFLEEHKDLTPRQSLVVSAVLQILSVEFGQAESSTEYWGEAV